MKFVSLLCLFLILSDRSASAQMHEGDCTHGMLFLSHVNCTSVYVMNLDSAEHSVTKLDMELKGDFPYHMGHIAGGLAVTAAYWGTEENPSAGYTNMIHTGVTLEDHGDHSHLRIVDPYLITNAAVTCTSYHPNSNHGMLAAFCDGDGTAEPPINSTVTVFDETMFRAHENSCSPVLATLTFPGSHHGTAYPVAKGHVLHSYPTDAVINRVPDADTLANKFMVSDYDGNVLHEFTDIDDPSHSCFAFHGSAFIDNTYYFACSADVEQHGGFLIVDYVDGADTYTSRQLTYPKTNLTNHRAGGIKTHHHGHYVLSDFADWDAEVWAPQLLAFKPDAIELGPEHVLLLPDIQCAYALEESMGMLVLVLLQSGMLQVYTPDPWTLHAEVQVLEAMTECPYPEPLAAGYMKAYMFANETLYLLDLHHVQDKGKIEMKKFDLGFVPYSMVVGGVPEGFGCM